MKHTTHGLVSASGICMLMATAPLTGAQAQAPAPAPASPAEPAKAADQSNEQTSYLFGLTFGEQLHSVGISNQVDTGAIERGIKAGLQGTKSTRSDQQQLQSFVQSVMAEQLTKNRAAAKQFLERNGKEKGVKTTADGLQYKVLVPGDAKAPAITLNDEVSVNYRGKLLDNTEFDSSYARNQPATFKVGNVIKGWTEALVMMKPGAKWQLFVPPELAYDASPRPGIPAGSLLIFDVDLLSVKPGTPPASGAVAPVDGGVPAHRTVAPVKPTNSGTDK